MNKVWVDLTRIYFRKIIQDSRTNANNNKKEIAMLTFLLHFQINLKIKHKCFQEVKFD